MKAIKYGVKLFDPKRMDPYEWCECWYEEYAPITIKAEYATYDINAAHRYLHFFQRNYPEFIYWVEEKP